MILRLPNLKLYDLDTMIEPYASWTECVPAKDPGKIFNTVKEEWITWCEERAQEDPNFKYKAFGAKMCEINRKVVDTPYGPIKGSYSSKYRYGPFFYFKNPTDAMLFRLNFG